MKLSEMTTDQATDFLTRVSVPIANIMEDGETTDLLKAISEMRDIPVTVMISKMLTPVVTLALRKHKKDLYEIIGAFSGKGTKEVGSMNIMETMGVLKEGIDKDFLDFFKSSGEQNKHHE